MLPLTPEGQKIIETLAQRYAVSTGAVMAMLHALAQGNGTMAQFSHPEFGGMVQWTQGGMTMVGDMFNNALKVKVDGLGSELAGLLATEPGLRRRSGHQAQSQSQGGGGGSDEVSLFVSSAGGPLGAWWPAELGAPSSTGSQNDVRYAYFPATRRLAIEVHGRVSVYDTEDHHITGVSQQQSADASLTFVSQKGLVRVADLRLVCTRSDGERAGETPGQTTAGVPRPVAEPVAGKDSGDDRAGGRAGDRAGAASAPPRPTPVNEAAPSDDVFFKIERLADLLKKGILSEEEFATKKAELLSRL
jgi:hypothetical protein